MEVVSPWHTMLYKTIDVPFIHFYSCDALCEVRTIQISIFMRIKFCGVWCNHRNCICVKHHVNLIFVKMKAICHIQFSCVTISLYEFAGKLNFYVAACNKLLRQPEDNPTIGLLLCKSKDQTKVEWAFDSIQNPIGVATYEGIKIKDKLPSVEDLKKRLDMVEQELREYKENEEASAKDGNYTSNQETK